MNFSALSSGAFFAGLAALGAVLFALQRLRVRHRSVQVITTLFWREAIEESRARVFVQRFRHPWAYLLVLLIAGLIWAGVAGPERRGDESRGYVLLLDASAGMARVDVNGVSRFDQAVEAMIAEVARLPRERTRVIFCGAEPRTLLLPGEEILLLSERGKELRPEMGPSTILREIERLGTGDYATHLRVIVVGDTPFGADHVVLQSKGSNLSSLPLPAFEARPNTGIIAFGAGPAASGKFGFVDLLIEISGDGAQAAHIALELDGKPQEWLAIIGHDGDHTNISLKDVPAAGQLAQVRLSSMPGGQADGFAGDDVASLVLPEQPPLRVLLAAGLDGALLSALQADPAVEILRDPAAQADVVVRRAGDVIGAGLPAMEWTPAAEQADAFLLRWQGSAADEGALSRAFEALGLAEIDATGLATEAGVEIRLSLHAGTPRNLSVWSELLGEGFDFTSARAFPLFIARALRWLASERPAASWLAAGFKTADWPSPLTDAVERRLDPLGAAFALPAAGLYRDGEGRTLAASLLDPASTTPAAFQKDLVPRRTDLNDGSPLTWILLLALALICVEWFLFKTGRMP